MCLVQVHCLISVYFNYHNNSLLFCNMQWRSSGSGVGGNLPRATRFFLLWEGNLFFFLMFGWRRKKKTNSVSTPSNKSYVTDNLFNICY